MSKSLGNFLTIDDMLKNYDANTLRLFILTNHYRMSVEFSDEALSSAQAGAKRLTNAKQTPINESLDITKTPEYKAFCDAMDEDLNTSKALAVLFDLTTRANKDEKDAYTILYKLGSALGFTFEKAGLSDEDLSGAIKAVSEALGQTFATMDDILNLRKKARAEKNWDIADKIRVSLDSAGIILKDTPEGSKIELK